MEKLLPKVRVGVGCMCIDGSGKALLLLRKGAHGEGTWSFPGGHLEFGETIEQCAVREIKEETNIDVTQIEIVSMSNDIAYEKHYITIGIVAREWTGIPRIMEPEKCIDMKWFDLDDLPKYVFIPTNKFIENYKASRFYNINDK